MELIDRYTQFCNNRMEGKCVAKVDNSVTDHIYPYLT